MKALFAKKEIAPLFVILVMLAVAVSFYQAPCLPDKMPTHWNATGEIDGWESKNFVLFFFPALTLAFYLLMTFLPLIDPLKENYKKFALSYFFIKLAFVLFFAFLYFYTLWASVAQATKINYLIIPAMSLLFVVLGALMPKIKKNYFVGIRTPWTLQSDAVWAKTHKFAGYTLSMAGLLGFLSILFKQYSFLFFIIVILIGGLLPIVYSYILYRKMKLFHNT